MSKQNISVFSYSFEGYAWKMYPDEEKQVLIVEVRNEEKREVSFTGIDLRSKKRLWDYESSDEKWWIGLKQAGFGKTVLYEMEGYGSPGIKGTEVLDSMTGKVLVKEKDFIPITLAGEGILGKIKGNETEVFLMDFFSGKILPGNQAKQPDERDGTIINPNRYSAENTFFPKLAEFIEFISGRKAVELIEYLEYKNKIIVSFYSPEGKKLVNYLLVSDQEGKILMEQELGRELAGLASDTFFLSGDLLIFVRNKKEVIISEL